MNQRVKDLAEAAVGLTPEERMELIEGIVDSLVPPDPEVDRAWADEAKDRLAAVLSGAMSSQAAEQVLADARARGGK